MAVSFMTLWSLWAFLLLVLFLKSAFAHQAEAVFRRDYRTIWLNLFRLWLQLFSVCSHGYGALGYVVSNEFRFWLNKTEKKISAENRCKSICSIGAEVSACLCNCRNMVVYLSVMIFIRQKSLLHRTCLWSLRNWILINCLHKLSCFIFKYLVYKYFLFHYCPLKMDKVKN